MTNREQEILREHILNMFSEVDRIIGPLTLLSIAKEAVNSLSNEQLALMMVNAFDTFKPEDIKNGIHEFTELIKIYTGFELKVPNNIKPEDKEIMNQYISTLIILVKKLPR